MSAGDLGGEQAPQTPAEQAPQLPEVIARARDLLMHGMPAEAEAAMAESLALHATNGADPGNARHVLFDGIANEHDIRTALEGLERWLARNPDAAAAVPLAVSWALPAADLDVEAVTHDAELYIKAYPREGRIIGDVPERTALWLVQRIALTTDVDPAQRLGAVRRAIGTLSEIAATYFPTAAVSLRAVATDIDDEQLWYRLVLYIAESEYARSAATW